MTNSSLATYVFSTAELQVMKEAMTKAIATDHSHDFVVLYKARIATIDKMLMARSLLVQTEFC